MRYFVFNEIDRFARGKQDRTLIAEIFAVNLAQSQPVE